MSEPDLDVLLRSEADRIEWKESARDGEKILQAVCALANDIGNSRQPGHVLIGVSPAGKVTGIDAAGGKLDQVQQEVSSRLRSTKILPTPSVSIVMRERDGKHVLVLVVEPYPVPPVVAVNSVAYVRVGSSTRRASDADLARLRERRPENLRPFDSRVLAGPAMEDLDLARLRAEYEAGRTTDVEAAHFPAFEAWLATRKQLGVVREERFLPFAAAVLLHGKSPQDHVPAATVELVRYAGTDVSSPVAFRKTITGTLPEQLDALWAQLSANVTSREVPAVGIRTEQRPDYPLEALKEFARNLVQHRMYEGTNAPGRVEWYDDHIEFSNPGGPFQRASEGEFGEHSDYRNPRVTAGLVDAGYVQQLGRGVRVARALLEKNGNPQLEVETDGFTRVIVRRRQ